MKTGTFRAFLKREYGDQAFTKDGMVSKSFVRQHQHEWGKKTRRRATFFLNTVQR